MCVRSARVSQGEKVMFSVGGFDSPTPSSRGTAQLLFLVGVGFGLRWLLKQGFSM